MGIEVFDRYKKNLRFCVSLDILTAGETLQVVAVAPDGRPFAAVHSLRNVSLSFAVAACFHAPRLSFPQPSRAERTLRLIPTISLAAMTRFLFIEIVNSCHWELTCWDARLAFWEYTLTTWNCDLRT